MRVGAGCVVFALLTAAPQVAGASTITVAEFRWDAELVDPGRSCDGGDPSCEPGAAVFLSTNTLTGLWDGPAPGPALTGSVAFADGNGFDWVAISPETGYVDQLAFETLLPASAATTVLFEFAGSRSLSAVLTAPGFALLQFETQVETVPEAGPLMLIALGVAGAARIRRAAGGRRSERR